MSESTESTRRWNGYVCPDCRFVFRVPRDHDGVGIVCPSCRRLLKIPASGDVPLPLMAPVRQTIVEVPPVPEVAEAPAGPRKRRRRRGGEEQSWESQAAVTGDERRPMGWWLAGGIVLLAGIGAAVMMTRGNGSGPKTPAPDLHPPPPLTTSLPVTPAERGATAILAEAEPVVRAFLEARSVEKLLPLVAHPELSGPRMREFYGDGKVPAPGLAVFNDGEGFFRDGDLFSVNVRTADYGLREIAFYQTAGGVRIDWESWVGWSEMTWRKFRADKPTEPKVFRAVAGKVAYYNFAFQDEAKWECYRLVSPDGDNSIYGYVEKGSETARAIYIDPEAKEGKFTFKLRFPEESATDNQVEIVGVVADGWVEREVAK